MIDTNAVIRSYLASDAGIVAIVGTRIHCPRLPEGCDLPALGFFTRGGSALQYHPEVVTPSIQLDCSADPPREARSLYGAVYDAAHAHWGYTVTIDGVTYTINSMQEEVHGQDMMDVDGGGSFTGYWRVLTFYRVSIKVQP